MRTPFPWVAKELHSTSRAWVILWASKLHGTHMKRLDSAGEFMESDARLLAASPDLLAAAQAAWNCIGELPPTQVRVEVAQMLQAAIEKATGETP